MTLIFTWWHSKQRFFCLSLSKSVFSIIFPRTTTSSYMKYVFWCSNFSKTSFGFFAENLSWFELCVPKKSIFSSSVSYRKRFGLFATKLVSLDFIQNNVFECFRTLNAHLRYEKKGKGCSGKHDTKKSVTYSKINRNAVWSKIK